MERIVKFYGIVEVDMTPLERRACLLFIRDAFPPPRIELEYQGAFQFLIAVLLSAQTTDKQVNKVTKNLFYLSPGPQEIVNLGLNKLEAVLKPIGLFRSKANYVYRTALKILSQHEGKVPLDYESLLGLPGVGRKTAHLVLSEFTDQPRLAVDRHVFRVCCRTGLAPGRTVRSVEDHLTQQLSRADIRNFHLWLVLHGRYTCLARRPRCGICPINPWCDFYRNASISVDV